MKAELKPKEFQQIVLTLTIETQEEFTALLQMCNINHHKMKNFIYEETDNEVDGKALYAVGKEIYNALDNL